MAVFSITITSGSKFAGVAVVRKAYNENKRSDDPRPWSTDEYVQCAWHAQQYGT